MMASKSPIAQKRCGAISPVAITAGLEELKQSAEARHR